MLKEEWNLLNKEDAKKVVDSKERLVFVETNSDSAIIKYKDLADAIVVFGLEFGDLHIWDPETGDDVCDTYGIYLNKCNSQTRKDIINRLTKLQLGEEEPKDIEIINPDDLLD